MTIKRANKFLELGGAGTHSWKKIRDETRLALLQEEHLRDSYRLARCVKPSQRIILWRLHLEARNSTTLVNSPVNCRTGSSIVSLSRIRTPFPIWGTRRAVLIRIVRVTRFVRRRIGRRYRPSPRGGRLRLRTDSSSSDCPCPWGYGPHALDMGAIKWYVSEARRSSKSAGKNPWLFESQESKPLASFWAQTLLPDHQIVMGFNSFMVEHYYV